jgi:hypothetical protein
MWDCLVMDGNGGKTEERRLKREEKMKNKK